MLTNSFCFLKKVSSKKEKDLWGKNIITWDDYNKLLTYQFSMLDENSDPFCEAKQALFSHDVLYFQKKMSPHNFFRILLSFPNEVLFLDIETTGLSLYYDIITLIGWSINQEYGYYITGTDINQFKKIVEKAKIIVTFNGTLFDLKFLKKSFPEIKFPTCHVDLRYFTKRVGLTGGQKKIEELLGYKRPHKIKEVLGENAPVLWYEYCRGNNVAIKKLIQYNFHDIEGMKFILDSCIQLYCRKENFPKKIIPSFHFYNKKTPLKIGDIPLWNTKNVKKISYNDLTEIIPLDDFCVVGIDLVASEQKESGLCILKGNNAYTARVCTDDELIAIIKENAMLVSIDSPLSIPKGRTSCWDDDINRKYGITRECERILKKRGISSYPCLIPSMQKLTSRGMRLADKIRKLGIPVIESYPGAAQDIMQIPRKQNGVHYLKKGLIEFGITGNYVHDEVSHDELDAITCSIVGLFFWSGMFEALGNDDEDYLIIPTYEKKEDWITRKCFVFSGIIGAGKTTAVNFLKQEGFISNRFSSILSQVLEELKIKNSRSNLQYFGEIINKFGFQRWLAKQTIKVLCKGNKIAVDGVRFLEDIATIKENFGPAVKHISILCDEKIIKKRKILNEDISSEIARKHDVEQEIFTLTQKSDRLINNESSLESFYQKLKLL